MTVGSGDIPRARDAGSNPPEAGSQRILKPGRMTPSMGI